MPLGDLAPVGDAGAPERVGADPHPGLADRVEVEHGRQVVDVGAEEVVGPAAARALANGDPADVGEPARISSLARAAITLVASESAGPPCGGLYLNPPSWGGLCEGVTTIPSASPAPVVRPWLARMIAWLTAGVGREAVAVVDEHRDVVGDEHLERGGPGGLGEGVGVATDEQRAVVALLRAVVADRLRGRERCASR